MKYFVSTTTTVNRTRRWESVVCPMHIHRYMELIVVTEGVLHIEIGRKHYIIEKGEAALVEALEPHSYLDDQPNTTIVIEFTKNMHPVFSDWIKTRNVKSKHFTLSPLCYEYINLKIPLETTVYRGHDAAKMQAFLCPIIDEFMVKCEFEISTKKYDDAFIEILDYITQNLNEEITLTSVSKKMNVRPDSLSRKFTDKCGISFNAFVQSLRLCEVCSLINKGVPISEAAMMSGFGSICSFNRTFKKIMKITPSEFKKRGSYPSEYFSAEDIITDEYDKREKSDFDVNS